MVDMVVVSPALVAAEVPVAEAEALIKRIAKMRKSDYNEAQLG